MNLNRPKTCKDAKIVVRQKQIASKRPSTKQSSKSSKHRRCASATQNLIPGKLEHSYSFGIEGYKTPHCGLMPRTDIRAKFSKVKYKNFVSEYTKSKDFVPPPNKYKLNRTMILNKKMYFGKGTRLTMTAEIIKNAKNTIGPGMYKSKALDKVKGFFNSTCRKSVWFLDESEFKGKNSPPFYNTKHVDKHCMTPDFKRQSKARKTKIEKLNSVAPNSYNTEESFSKTQLIKSKWKFLKCKRFLDSERIIKLKSSVPAPGHYNIEKAEKKMYKKFGPQKQ